ncbi:MAG: SecDF P1 head subdomain-containing protein [Psychrobacter sp.]|uniref:SecDF P1 head subdomain-containing protein n=1 Tax=Psychrobacter sp. TaxID=56811 RepID=UPI00264813CC|nr:hypothetical protein [Psychrobacter sp.]MDN6276729.1 hypothetical protein [Psychrobacter sp.]MDN6308205.1 hypothetical protein [Psychrobacter sp.]
MGNLFLVTCIISIGTCANISNADGFNLDKQTANIPKQTASVPSSCDSAKDSTAINPGFYIVDNVEGDVIEKVLANAYREFLPIDAITGTQLSHDRYDEYALYIDIDGESSRKLQAMTRKHIGKQMITVANDEVIHSANIQAPLSSSFRITGLKTLKEAETFRSKIDCAIR